jgi:hypothetical protein
VADFSSSYGRFSDLVWPIRRCLHPRRFRLEDTEQLREQMFTGLPPLREDDDVTPARARPID